MPSSVEPVARVVDARRHDATRQLHHVIPGELVYLALQVGHGPPRTSSGAGR